MEPEITWAEFLQGHALPHSKLRFDPLNHQRTVKWASTDIPAWRATDGSFPQMRSNIMELVSRYQQAAWWPYSIYTESILTTLIITRKFGQAYPQFDSSHQYGITKWYKLTMYCVYGNRHWSLVCIFITARKLMVVRIDPTSPEIDKDTQYILDHLKWASQLGPDKETYLTGTEDVLLDITVPPSQDTHSCGLRVLQYHRIIGEAVAQHPEILDGEQANIQEFLRSVVLPQLQAVNTASTEHYYQEMRTAILNRDRETTPKCLPTWPTSSRAGAKRRTRVTLLDGQDLHPIDERPVKTSRQLQLWEPHPGKADEQTRHDDPLPAESKTATPSPSMQEEERQLQVIHRWLEESTQEEIQAQRHEAAAKGSHILRSLTLQKRNARHQGRWNHQRAHISALQEEAIQGDSADSTIMGIISWLNWITEMESQQPSQTIRSFSPREYLQHLQTTYEAHVSEQERIQEIPDVSGSPSGNQEISTASNAAAIDADSISERQGKQDVTITPPQQNHHPTKPSERSFKFVRHISCERFDVFGTISDCLCHRHQSFT